MRALPLGLPFQGRWLGEAETERLSRICNNLSVCSADSSPARGAFGVHPVGAKQIKKTYSQKGAA